MLRYIGMMTKQIGERSEGAVLAALLKAGKVVLLPFGGSQRYDLLVDDDGSFQRIQCKTGRMERGGIEFNTSSTHYHRGNKSRDYRGQVDFFGVYCPDNDKVYLIPVDDVGTHNGFLRLEVPKNGQVKGIRMASQYELNAV